MYRTADTWKLYSYIAKHNRTLFNEYIFHLSNQQIEITD